jgi:hypothetical protein
MSSWAWFGVAALALVGAWLGWRAWRARAAPRVTEERIVDAGARDQATAALAAPEALAPVVPEALAPVVPEALAPVVPEALAPVVPEALAPVVPEALAPVALRVPPAVAPVEPAAGEPADEVLALARADRSSWDAASALECAAETLATLTDLLAANVPMATPPQGGAVTIYAVHFEGDDALPVARANPSRLHDLAARRHAAAVANGGGGPEAARVAWLGGTASAMLAGTVLGAWTRTRHLVALEEEVAEIKSLLTALQIKLDDETLRAFKPLVQDLSRFMREARDNYSAVIRKPVYLERVAEAAAEATRVWLALQERPRAIRAQLAALADAPRYGEVQLERSVLQLQALHGERRVQALGARLVAALNGLRLALGDSAASPGVPTLASLCATLRSDADAERALLRRVTECERGALGPPYAGKGEFESNRAAARGLLSRLGTESAEGAGLSLQEAQGALAAGFLDGQARDWTLLLRVDDAGRVSELRRRPRAI